MNEDESGISREPMQGRYSNYCRVGQNAMEFVIDFGERYGEQDMPIFHTRIVTNPTSMKAIIAALEEAVDLYDRRFPQNPEGV